MAVTPALQWLSIDLLTGKTNCALPGIVIQDANRRTLGQYESQDVLLNVTAATSPSWLSGTRPFTSALIAYRDTPDVSGPANIIWGGVVLRRQRTLGTNQATITLATPECYLDRRYTGAYTTDPTDVGATRNQNTIVSDLVADFVIANQGLPITVVTVSNGASVPSILATYNDYDDKTVYSNLGALMGQLNGPEFTAHWSWDPTTNLVTPVLYVGNRIGAAVRAGLAPAVVFDQQSLTSGLFDENYTTGMGANDIEATSSGQGLARPVAMYPNPAATSFDGRPRVQYRYQPATSIDDTLTLQQHAQSAWGLLADGTNTVTIQSPATSGPQLGIDWNLGDDIGYQFPDSLLFPGGISGVGRCIGYESTDTTTSPVLYVPQVS